MRYQETILCSSGASSSGQSLGSVTVHDFQTGSLLASYKQTSAQVHSTSIYETSNGQGGFILAAQSDKSLLNAYYFQKDQIAVKMVLPEKLSCIAISNSGDFCAGGTSQGRIYFWEIGSGILFNVWDAHYRKISVLRFTHDGAALISGSDDSGVSVWLVSSLLANEAQNDIPTPYCTLPDHTLPITDIVCGVGVFPSCRILTSSLDHSAKIWDLTKSLLTTFIFPSPIQSLAFEVAERAFFAATSGPDGIVYKVKLFRQRDYQSSHSVFEALGGGGTGEAIRLEESSKNTITIGQSISSMVLSINQSTLLVGTTTGEVLLYDVTSHQLLRTINPVKDKSQGLAITYIHCMLKPPDLIGHISFGIDGGGASDAKDAMPTKPITPFQRIRDSKAREAHEVPILLPIQGESYTDPTIYSTEELSRDHALIFSSGSPNLPNSNGVPSNSQLSQESRVSELEAEIQLLRSQLSKAKGLNDAMWETVVQRAVADKKSTT